MHVWTPGIKYRSAVRTKHVVQNASARTMRMIVLVQEKETSVNMASNLVIFLPLRICCAWSHFHSCFSLATALGSLTLDYPTFQEFVITEYIPDSSIQYG